MLANIYMHRFLRHWRRQGKGGQYRARLIHYADDFVILSRGKAREAMEWTRQVMNRLGLTLNPAKTCVRDAWKETFDCLGYTFGQQIVYTRAGMRQMDARPSKRSIARVKRKLHEVLQPWNTGSWSEVVERVNRLMVGWSNYFNHGTLYFAHRGVRSN